MGAAFGWVAAGRGMRSMFAASALASGVVIAGAAVWAGVYAGAQPLGFRPSVVGILASIVLLTLLYGLGAWLGLLSAEQYVGNRSRIITRRTRHRSP